jgi:hypothetical protein
MGYLTNNFLFKDRRALSDQMSFVLTFHRRGFTFGIRNRDRTDLDEIAIFAFSVPTQDFPHDILLYTAPNPGSPYIIVQPGESVQDALEAARRRFVRMGTRKHRRHPDCRARQSSYREAIGPSRHFAVPNNNVAIGVTTDIDRRGY